MTWWRTRWMWTCCGRLRALSSSMCPSLSWSSGNLDRSSSSTWRSVVSVLVVSVSCFLRCYEAAGTGTGVPWVLEGQLSLCLWSVFHVSFAVMKQWKLGQEFPQVLEGQMFLCLWSVFHVTFAVIGQWQWRLAFMLNTGGVFLPPSHLFLLRDVVIMHFNAQAPLNFPLLLKKNVHILCNLRLCGATMIVVTG